MARICIIPARSGSKRIPKKAIKDFHGKPIMSYSIETALKSELFDEVMVSTDSEEFAEVAQSFGAKVPFLRSAKNADDHATTLDALKEVLEKYQEQGLQFDECCCLYPAAPMVQPKHLFEAKEKIQDGFTSVFAAVAYGHPIQRAFKLKKEKAMMISPEYQNTRSQDLEKCYHDAGQFYFFKVKDVLQQNKIFTSHCSFVELDALEVQDIDEPSDWRMAELKFKLLNE